MINIDDNKVETATNNADLNSNNENLDLIDVSNQFNIDGILKEISNLKSKCGNCKLNYQMIYKDIVRRKDEFMKEYYSNKKFNSAKEIAADKGPEVQEFDRQINNLNNGFDFSFLCHEHIMQTNLKNLKDKE